MQFNDLMWGRSPTSHICPEAFVNALLNDSDDDVMAPPKKRSDGTSLGVASTCERPSSQGPSSQGSSLASSVDGGGGDGHTLDESVASVERSAISSSPPNNKQRRPETPSEKDNSDNANVFVTHLPPQVEDTVLRGMFEPFGPVVSCVIMRDIFSGASRGVGFVLFQSPTAAQQAIAAMHRTTVLGKTITVQYGKMFAQGVPTTRMFVRNIPKTVSEEEMRALCAPFGDVTWISLHADSVKSSSAKKTSAGAGTRNIAFVNFATAAQAKAAADALHTTRPFAATHHHHSTPLAPSESGGDDHHGGSCCVCVDDDAPLLTKVVVEDLPNKTSRKERRSVGRTAHALQEDGGRRGERPQRQRATSGAGQRPEPATGVVQACINEAELNPKNQPSLVVVDGNGARNASQKTTHMPATKASKKTTKGKQQVPSTVDDASGHANRVCPQPMVVRLPLPPPPPPYTSSSISAW